MLFNMVIKAFIDWMVKGAVEGWKATCKIALQAGNITDNQWDAASQMVGHLGGLMMFVCIITAAVNIVRMVIRKRTDLAVLVFSQAILSWPLTMISMWLIVRINNIAAQVTGAILNMDFSQDVADYKMPDLKDTTINAASGVFGPALMVIFLLLIVLSMVSIVVCMAARDFLLLMSVSFISVQFMNIVDRQFDSIRRYFYFMLGLILYQPVCASLIWLTGELMKRSGSDNALTFVMALVGMAMSSVAPWVLIRKLMPSLGPEKSGLDAASRSAEGTAKTTKDTVEKVGGMVASAVTGAKLPSTGGAGKAAGLLGSLGGKQSKGKDGTDPGIVSVDTRPGKGGGGPETGQAPQPETPIGPMPEQGDENQVKAPGAIPDMRSQGRKGMQRLADAARGAAEQQRRAGEKTEANNPDGSEEEPPTPESALPPDSPVKTTASRTPYLEPGMGSGLRVDQPTAPAPDGDAPAAPGAEQDGPVIPGSQADPPLAAPPEPGGGSAPILPSTGPAGRQTGAEGVGGVAPTKGTADVQVDQDEQ